MLLLQVPIQQLRLISFSKAVAKIEEINGAKFDIVFCGKEATDFSKGMVGVQLASELGVSVATDVIAVDPAEGEVLLNRKQKLATM